MSYSLIFINEIKLMRKQGYSLGEISKKYKISKSTASLWTSKEKISKSGRIRIKKRQDRAREKAFNTLRDNRGLVKLEIEKRGTKTMEKIIVSADLARLITAIFIWTEGEKGRFNRMGFTNSDPLMVSTFLKLMRQAFHLDESKFRGLVHIHEYHNEKEIIQFWSKLTKIPKNQFTRSYLKPHTGKRKRENYKGSIHITYFDYKVARELAYTYNMFAGSLGL